MIQAAKKKLSGFVDRLGIGGELLRYLWKQKMWWLIPIVLFLLIVSAFLIFVQGAAVAPFIYTLI